MFILKKKPDVRSARCLYFEGCTQFHFLFCPVWLHCASAASSVPAAELVTQPASLITLAQFEWPGTNAGGKSIIPILWEMSFPGGNDANSCMVGGLFWPFCTLTLTWVCILAACGILYISLETCRLHFSLRFFLFVCFNGCDHLEQVLTVRLVTLKPTNP